MKYLIPFILLVFCITLHAEDGKITKEKIGKTVTITGVGNNTKDGLYLGDYIIDDFQLPKSADGKKIELTGILKNVIVINSTPNKTGEIVQTREGSWTHLLLKDIKWKVSK